MTRQRTKQILAFCSLAGFFGVAVLVLIWPDNQKTDMVFGAAAVLVTKVMSDYFGDQHPDDRG